ncbi:MSMEG_0565 family glycosyltransferase [Microbacterium sp. SORGH_AS_0888]|uniref:MSMEG_0565 family glycosyltransferase n=1 Tax=Microbacterium sp. SORGH_AS_0888 TaxID=3041791 RepID=UPI002785B42B|nr:MSMEG_0565 family glycosyltransferase [Microbacterium sp. SORGH_AS_0888]MDQ1129201.1 glycosyltransferase-like protein [Microbacterium sp. SORGH_AS_0888]
MRIAQLTYSTKPRGGVVHTLALAEALADRGHDVQVWTLGRGADTAFFRPVDARVDIRVIPFPPRDGEDVGERIERSIRTMTSAFDIDADVVHAQDCISANAAVRRGIPVIRTIHHLDAFTTPQLVECHDRAVTEPFARLCVSHAVAREVEDAYGVRPTVIPNGVDSERFALAAGPEGEAGRSRWRGRLGDYILALGGIEPRKGSLDLLEGFAIARASHPGLALVFGGGETLFDYRDYRARFDERARELGITPVILGTIDEPDLPALVAAARALAFVSTKEGFGLAAMEAVAAGVPVIARDLPVIREVFGDTVRYARNGPQIAARVHEVLTDPAPRRRDEGVDLAARHTWEAAAAAHEAFYREMLITGGARGPGVVLPDHR